MKTKIRKRERIAIFGYHDLNCIMSDMVDEFIEDFPDREGLTSGPDEIDTFFDTGVEFYFTEKGDFLVDRYIDRLKRIFIKYYDEYFFDVKPSGTLT